MTLMLHLSRLGALGLRAWVQGSSAVDEVIDHLKPAVFNVSAESRIA